MESGFVDIGPRVHKAFQVQDQDQAHVSEMNHFWTISHYLFKET